MALNTITFVSWPGGNYNLSFDWLFVLVLAFFFKTHFFSVAKHCQIIYEVFMEVFPMIFVLFLCPCPYYWAVWLSGRGLCGKQTFLLIPGFLPDDPVILLLNDF